MLNYINKITNDQSGNYCVQKILEIESIEKKKIIINEICKDVLKISQNSYGSKVIQRIFDVSDLSLKQQIAEEIIKLN